MNIVWLSWKDRWHPQAGGAETVSGEIMDRLAKNGHKITLLTSLYEGADKEEIKNGVRYIRSGNRYTVYLRYRSELQKMPATNIDYVIDEMNTIPFLPLSVPKDKRVLLFYQLAREVWFYQMPFPISLIGYLIEPIYLLFMSNKYAYALTESNSSKIDIEKYRFSNVHIFNVGIDSKPLSELQSKDNLDSILSFGSIRPMKRTLEAIKAFEAARDINLELRLTIAGDNTGAYAEKVTDYIATSRHTKAIDVIGRVSLAEKNKLMKEASVILVTSIKEGWGLIVTETNSQGTPAIVYDVDGLRDSVRKDLTGIITDNSKPEQMGKQISELLKDRTRYEKIREAAWVWSKDFTFDNSFASFMRIIDKDIDKDRL